MAGTVIVGAGHAGVQAAVSLRQAGYPEPIRLVSNEDRAPYHRPPLSKAMLAGEKRPEQIALRGPDYFDRNGIELMLGARARALDPASKTVRLADGSLAYDKAVIATGAGARMLDGFRHDNVFLLRSMQDALSLQDAMGRGTNLVIVGGGFIGLEVAATARKLGLSVDVVEMQDRLLTRAIPEALSDYICRRHRAEGVRIHLGAEIDRIDAEAGRIASVELSNGASLAADLVLVGVGNAPETGLGAEAGAETALGGILVDGSLKTTLPDVYAIGDCATFHLPAAGGRVRLESVQNAVDQGRAVAAEIAGQGGLYDAVPWFWSDQFDMKLQMAGLSVPGGAFTLRGAVESGSFSLVETLGDRLVAVYSVNAVADHMASRRLIGAPDRFDRHAASNKDIPLKACLAAPMDRCA
ncbi:MAG: pyridine nucleotide-disulfide oxidoreductase [Alphaproteobacteria bacterium]|nr:pyridine nucleotide-disulfide oxidoreductase [Alphaproteobacteria bacterium]